MGSTAHRIGIVASLLFGAGTAIACGGGAANAPLPVTAVSTTTADEDATTDRMDRYRYHHHGGVALLIAMSLDTLGVSSDQQAAVEKTRADLHSRMEPAHAAEQSLVAALADGVASANLDSAKIDAAVARVTAAAGAVHDASTDALNSLHRVLTSPQREALVDKVEAHWAVWQRTNAEEPGPTYPNDGHVATLAMSLGLNAEQVDTIRAGLGDHARALPRLDPQEIANHLHAFGDAFRSEKFDAKALPTASSANAHMVGWGAAHLARFVETISPVLTPDQRAQFAQKLREHATHNLSDRETLESGESATRSVASEP
jgi:Spy/CpxP family protein refolding chaperone